MVSNAGFGNEDDGQGIGQQADGQQADVEQGEVGQDNDFLNDGIHHSPSDEALKGILQDVSNPGSDGDQNVNAEDLGGNVLDRLQTDEGQDGGGGNDDEDGSGDDDVISLEDALKGAR